MLYKLKIYHYGWHIINGKLKHQLTREHVIEIINTLNLKSVRGVKKNKKPYIMVKLTSEDEYLKLRKQLKQIQTLDRRNKIRK